MYTHVCVYTYMHTCIHANIHNTYIHIYIYTWTNTHIYRYTYPFHICAYAGTQKTRTHEHTRTHAHTYTHKHIRTDTHIQREKERERHTHTHTHSYTHTDPRNFFGVIHDFKGALSSSGATVNSRHLEPCLFMQASFLNYPQKSPTKQPYVSAQKSPQKSPLYISAQTPFLYIRRRAGYLPLDTQPTPDTTISNGAIVNTRNLEPCLLMQAIIKVLCSCILFTCTCVYTYIYIQIYIYMCTHIYMCIRLSRYYDHAHFLHVYIYI